MSKTRATARLAPLVLLALPGCSGDDDHVRTDLLGREVLFGPTQAANGVLSPSGRHLVYARPHRGRLNLWLRPLDATGGPERPLTEFEQDGVGQFAFARDSRHVVFLRDTGGDENDHLMTVDITEEPAVVRDLTPVGGVKAELIALPSADPDHALVGLNDRDPGVHDVYRIALADGTRTLLRRNDAGYSRWWADNDGALALALEIEDSGDSVLWDVSQSPPRRVMRCLFTEVCAPQRFHDRERLFYMITNRGDDDLTRLVLVDPEYGSMEPVHRDPRIEADVGQVIFSNEDGRLLGVSYLGDRQRTYSLDSAFTRDLKIVTAALPDADVVFRSWTADDRFWLVKEVVDVDEGSNYLYDSRSTLVSPLYESFPDIPRDATTRRRAVRYVARDGAEIPAYVTKPRDWRRRGVMPAVVIVHGGPWDRDTWGWDAEAQFLANRGYVVLQPNFRGSTGYGKRYLNAGNGEWGLGVMQTDLEDGVRWMVSEGWVDPQRVAIKGVSYGGYAALAGLTFSPRTYAAGIAIAAPADLPTLLESLPAYWAPQRDLLHRRIGHPERDADRLAAASPLNASERIRAPLMIMQGANDPRVPRALSDRMAAAARDAGAEVRYLLAPDQGHAFTGRDRMAAMAAIEHFLAEHLGGDAQPLDESLRRRIESLSVDVAALPPVASGAP